MFIRGINVIVAFIWRLDVIKSENDMEVISKKINNLLRFWNDYISKILFFESQISGEAAKHKTFVSDLLVCLDDTMAVIFNVNKKAVSANSFSRNISLLQAIYCQQDLVEELMKALKCKNLDSLRQDYLHSDNRKLRNQLVGHPVNRDRNNVLESSVLYSYSADLGVIEYGLYHRDNDFEFELVSCPIVDILEKHEQFLEKYINLIYVRCRQICNRFSKKIQELCHVINKNDFDLLLKVLKTNYQTVFYFEDLYESNTIEGIFKKREDHPRYGLFLNEFYSHIYNSIQNCLFFFNEVFGVDLDMTLQNMIKERVQNCEKYLNDAKEEYLFNSKKRISYEIGKLYSPQDEIMFNLHLNCLKDKLEGNEILLKEVDYMLSQKYDRVEYMLSLKFIGKVGG